MRVCIVEIHIGIKDPSTGEGMAQFKKQQTLFLQVYSHKTIAQGMQGVTQFKNSRHCF